MSTAPVRHKAGYDPAPLADEAAILATLSPKEAVDLRLTIPAAISLGFGREVSPEEGEVDLGLAELNAQKKHRDAGPLSALRHDGRDEQT